MPLESYVFVARWDDGTTYVGHNTRPRRRLFTIDEGWQNDGSGKVLCIGTSRSRDETRHLCAVARCLVEMQGWQVTPMDWLRKMRATQDYDEAHWDAAMRHARTLEPLSFQYAPFLRRRSNAWQSHYEEVASLARQATENGEMTERLLLTHHMMTRPIKEPLHDRMALPPAPQTDPTGFRYWTRILAYVSGHDGYQAAAITTTQEGLADRAAKIREGVAAGRLALPEVFDAPTTDPKPWLGLIELDLVCGTKSEVQKRIESWRLAFVGALRGASDLARDIGSQTGLVVPSFEEALTRAEPIAGDREDVRQRRNQIAATAPEAPTVEAAIEATEGTATPDTPGVALVPTQQPDRRTAVPVITRTAPPWTTRPHAGPRFHQEARELTVRASVPVRPQAATTMLVCIPPLARAKPSGFGRRAPRVDIRSGERWITPSTASREIVKDVAAGAFVIGALGLFATLLVAMG